MRCYNGCPDNELQAYLNSESTARAALLAIGIRPTYFPVEQKWMGFRENTAVTGWYNSIYEMWRAYE